MTHGDLPLLSTIAARAAAQRPIVLAGGSAALAASAESRRFALISDDGASLPANLAGVGVVDLAIALPAARGVQCELDAAMALIRSALPVVAARSGSLTLIVEDNAAAPAALEALIRSLARESGGAGVRINMVEAPSGVVAERIVDAIEFLAGPDAGFVAGTRLRLNAEDAGPSRSASPILLIGASEGIGAACARRLASEGVEVVVAGRRLDAARHLADEILAAGGVARPMALDATSVADWRRAVEALGPLGGIVSNVGACRLGASATMAERDVALMLSANVATHQNALAVGLRAIERGGRLVLTGSVAALRAAPGNAMYSASKAAILDLVADAWRRAAARGVSLHIIHPGLVFNDNVVRSHGAKGADALRDAIVSGTPLGRPAAAEDIGNAMAALLRGRLALDPMSPLVVDGGFAA